MYRVYAITIYNIQYTKIYDSNIHDYSSSRRICQNQIFILIFNTFILVYKTFFTFHSKRVKCEKQILPSVGFESTISWISGKRLYSGGELSGNQLLSKMLVYYFLQFSRILKTQLRGAIKISLIHHV